MIRQFLSEVDWGTLDYLILDTPPGASDEHLSATSYLKDTGITGAIIITTPPQVALLDVRKEINFCEKVNIPILGVVENMSIFVCPKCKVRIIRFGNIKEKDKNIDEKISLYAEYCRNISSFDRWWTSNVKGTECRIFRLDTFGPVISQML